MQAFDAYPVQVDLWLPRPDVEARAAEARAWLGRLVPARPDLPMLLIHDVALLCAAYLPGQPVHDFTAGTSVDFPDTNAWLPWVIKTDAMIA